MTVPIATESGVPKRKPIDPKLRGKCHKCENPARTNPTGKPEIFVECALCQREGNALFFYINKFSYFRTIHI